MITAPTRITETSATLIDVILTNNPNILTKCGTHEPSISDHQLIYGFVSAADHKQKSKVVSFRSTKNLNIGKFNEDLSNALCHVGECLYSKLSLYILENVARKYYG